MKFRITTSLITLVLVIALVIGGVTMAWFTSKASPPAAASFVTGTMDIEITGEDVAPDDFRWEIGEMGNCREFTWTVKNSGSKKVFLRARIEETVLLGETAWGEGKRFVDRGNWAMYFGYTVGGSANTVNFIAGQDFNNPAGEVSVSNDSTYLYVTYSTNEEWEMLEVHLAVTDGLDLIPATRGGPVPGGFPFKEKFEDPKGTHTFKIPLYGTYPKGATEDRDYEWGPGDAIYIAAHADLIGSETIPAESMIEWTQRDDPGCGQWDYNENDGFWYYCRQPVVPGEEVSFCLTGCPLKTGQYNVYLEIEAVQNHPEAVVESWGKNIPCLQGQ